MANWLVSRRKEAVAILAIVVFLFVSYSAYLRTQGGIQLSILTQNISAEPPAEPLVVDDAAEYRRLLNTVRPLDALPHSKTLGVASRIYVIELPGRQDRRAIMESLEKAMDITFTWHNATDFHSPIITEIARRVQYTREENKEGYEKEFADDVTSDDFLQPGDISGSELWFLPPSSPLALPPLPNNTETNVTDIDWPARPEEIACWHSHFEVLRKIADGDDDVALIFEDDIDMEWDLERRLRYLWSFLPDNWDMVLIGHCFSHESVKEHVWGNSYLHPTNSAMCTHGYAVSKKSATRLVRFLRSPLFAYSRPIDHAFIMLNSDKHIESFSVYPPIVTQSATTASDIFGGMGPGHDPMADSALERVRLWEESKQVQSSGIVRRAVRLLLRGRLSK